MYIPKSKQKVNAPLDGGTLYDVKTGTVYTGMYVKDYLGNYYKGDNITGISERLEYVPVESNPVTGNNTFLHYYIKPTSDDYVRGSFIRYFIKDVVTNLVKEVPQIIYLTEEKLQKPYRKSIQIEWYLAKRDIFKNRKAIEEAEKILPSISQQILRSPEQFVV